MSRIYADFLPLESSDTAKNYGLLPPVVKVLLSIPNDIEFLVSRTDKEEVTEIRKAFQVAVSDYIRKARELVRHYRTDRSAGIMNFTARNTRLGPGVNLTYVSNYGVEYITIRIDGDEARQIVKKLKEEEEKLCLMVLYNNNSVLAIPMDGIAGGNFRVAYRATLKSNWTQATARASSTLQSLGEWAPLYTYQLKLGAKTHVACIGGVSFESGKAEYIESSSYMANTSKSLLGGVTLPRTELTLNVGGTLYQYPGTVTFNGDADTVYTPAETLTISQSGKLELSGSRNLSVDSQYTNVAPMVDRDGGRYCVEAYGYYWASPASFTDAQRQAAQDLYDAGINTLYLSCGPGDAEIRYAEVYDDGTTYSGTTGFPVPVFTQSNGLDRVELQFVDVSVSYLSTPFPGDSSGDFYEYSGFGFSFYKGYNDIFGTGMEVFGPENQFPSFGTTTDKLFASGYSRAESVTRNYVAYTPYEQISASSTVFTTFIAMTLHVSNGKHYIQGYRAVVSAAWGTNQKFFLDGRDISSALENVTGVSSNQINSMLMDIKLSDIKKLK